ncbi:MAG: hypothetical protein VX874_11300 [Pseudomonadota bacterium]|nr:hypothetical protein [Pseudomonadota bacterium]
MKIYIQTIPKSGTYFMAAYLGHLGFNDTGLHVGLDHVLRTHDFDHKTNVETPWKTRAMQPFAQTIRDLAPGDVAFGHMPVGLQPIRFPGVIFICCYRHPRTTLMSEFVDFRFRRRDVPWISASEIPDDRAAFVTYLRTAGPEQMETWRDLLRLRRRVSVRWPGFAPRRYAFVNFDAMLTDPRVAADLARRLGIDPARAPAAMEAARASETKTKATSLTLDRAAFWSDEAEAAYAALGAERYVDRATRLGLPL